MFDLNADGVQTSPFPSTIQNGSGKTGGIYCLYAQDEWKLLPGLTLNYGGRFDLVDELGSTSASNRVLAFW